jgi:hypothetical protein
VGTGKRGKSAVRCGSGAAEFVKRTQAGPSNCKELACCFEFREGGLSDKF